MPPLPGPGQTMGQGWLGDGVGGRYLLPRDTASQHGAQGLACSMQSMKDKRTAGQMDGRKMAGWGGAEWQVPCRGGRWVVESRWAQS